MEPAQGDGREFENACKFLSQAMEEAMADGKSFAGWVIELEAEHGRLVYENEKLRDAIEGYILHLGYTARSAVLAAGLDPWWGDDPS